MKRRVFELLSGVLIIACIGHSLFGKELSQEELLKYVRMDMSKIPCEIIIDDEALYRDYGARSQNCDSVN